MKRHCLKYVDADPNEAGSLDALRLLMKLSAVNKCYWLANRLLINRMKFQHNSTVYRECHIYIPNGSIYVMVYFQHINSLNIRL